jgi:hypothetical protein
MQTHVLALVQADQATLNKKISFHLQEKMVHLRATNFHQSSLGGTQSLRKGSIAGCKVQKCCLSPRPTSDFERYTMKVS